MAAFLVLIANAADGDIATFVLDSSAATPALVRLATNPVGAGCCTFAIDTARGLVYAGVKEGPAIISLALDRETGTLTEIGRTPVADSMVYLTLAPGGTLLLGASYGGGFGAVWPISEGRPGAATAHVEYPNLHAIITSADGRFAYAPSLGSDLIAQYRLAPSGTLTPLAPPTVSAPEGSGPRHIVLNAAGTRLYCLTEFTGEAIGYRRDPASGLLSEGVSVPGFATDRGLATSALGVDPKVEHVIWGADLQLSSDERWLLCTERRESTLASIALDADGLPQHQVSVIPTEAQPRGFCVVPGTDLAVVVGERSTTASLYRLSGDTSPTLVDRVVTGNGANWVRAIAR